MIFSSKKSLEDAIVEVLLERTSGLRGPEILLEVRKYKPDITKQALYSALRLMIRDGIIVRLKGIFTLSSLWKQKMVTFLTNGEDDFLVQSLYVLQDGESISYNFKSFTICDRYWSHIDNLLIPYAQKYGTPIHFFNPHNWFFCIKNEVENLLIDTIISQEIPLYITLGNLTSIDLSFQKTFNKIGVSSGYNEDMKGKNTWYCNVFGDFIIEVTITQRLADLIGGWYQHNDRVDEISINSLKNIINTLSPVHLKVTRNSKKALLLQRKFMKIF